MKTNLRNLKENSQNYEKVRVSMMRLEVYLWKFIQKINK